jgi:isopentenyl-diphosphate delta-isomerase
MEQIVIVDENDNYIGEEDKEKCHDGSGILHRGFLVMVFDRSGELFLTRRSRKKRLWPGFWDGTVASHVRKGEDYEQASKRRLTQEIGVTADSVRYLFKFHYRIGYKDLGAENEICAVTTLAGIEPGSILPDSDEISEVKTISPRLLIGEIGDNGAMYTPWLNIAVQRMVERGLL